MERKIIHVDMDAFFASVEERDHPELRGKPVAVGFDGPRGVVSTANYVARRFGVHSAMPMAQAKRLCPELLIAVSEHERYEEVSAQTHEIFRQYTDIIEPLSIDEAFLDVTENKQNMQMARDIAIAIRHDIKEMLGLTASAGVSYNKFLAKIASDYRKPDGLTVIHPERALDFIAGLPIERFWGVGPKTASMMHRMGIYSGRDLRRFSLEHLADVFGKAGSIYYNFARGIDERAVEPVRLRKSVGCERTFPEDINRHSALLIELYHTVIELLARLGKSGFTGCTLTLKVKFADFSQITRSATQSKTLDSKDTILPLAKRLLREADLEGKAVRLIGLAVSNPPDDCHASEWVEGTLKFLEWDDFK